MNVVPWFVRYPMRWLRSWLGLIDAIGGIISFGVWLPCTSFRFAVWDMKITCRYVDKRAKEKV